ncbi:SusC/RagA family TonB-linked outer membrane protein [Microvirga sp. STR05]|uniref:SusC/RagA family TonB-linked outer membrane protein n=1 Tax=Hymenobacter duratus TaxID=2771356 RepID=A0ABR8JGV4_9BACT|nr:SusC/RagA family TonB-linked outer membrane protein [Hymenobacter duratus]MBD2714928.1 SusC/RagA family TonB-linked outer membrane protein [Hymenobacter duratus]MBR7949834.1 SusC/RagA family TonB-linked outer membrane protein [Microvirga sp. STR05]
MNRLYLLAPALSVVAALPGHAQQNLRTISGTVIDANRTPLPGVTVLVKGTTTGASTGTDGRYTLQAAPGSTLTFSFIGYTTQERAIGDDTSIDISLKENTTALNDVIVTAFGIKQERRQVNYGAQEVTSKDIIESRQPNIVNALQGKVAGVQVTSSGGGAGEGASIVIRGGNSLDGDNQPLFVIDGIIMDNTSFVESTAPGGGSAFNGLLGRSVSSQNRAADINPEDVETMTVLKGPAAAALYGLRAANGAVIITTKKGKSGVVTVDYRTQVSVDQVNRLPKLQGVYKQGALGVFDANTRSSWGPQFAPGETVYDNLGDFYKTAYNFQNYLTVTGGTDKGSFLLSASHLDQTGVARNSEFDKSTVRLSGTLQVSPKIRAQGSAQYLNSGGRRPLQGPGLFGGSGGYMVSLLTWPRNDDARNYLNPDGTRRRLIGGIGSSDADNPYFTVERNPITDRTNRVIGNAQVTYEPTKWLTLNYNLGTDYYTEKVRSIRAVGTSQPGNQDGGISETTTQNRLLNSNLTAVLSHSFSENISGSLLLGNSVEQGQRETTDIIGLVFRSPNFNSINNTVNRGALTTNSTRRLVGNFARVNLDLFKQVTMEVSARYDMSSTLPRPSKGKNYGQGFLYGSATLGYEFSRTLGLDNNSILNYGKLRLAVAEVGKDTGPYRVESPLAQSTYIGQGFRQGFFGSNSLLKPERTRSYEAGLDFQFLKGRLGLDAGVYYSETRDQLIAPRVSQASGYILQYINGGTVTNKGVEIALNGRPVQTTSGFTWDVLANFFHNQNRAKNLPSFLTEVNQSDSWVIDVARGSAFPNRPITSIGVQDYARVTDPNSPAFGQIIISPTTGYPSVVAGTYVYAGDRAPQFTTQITNTLAYKGLSLAFMLDFRKGGDVVNGNEWVAVRSGLSEKTLDRNKTAVIEGVVRNSDGSYSPNTRPVELTQGYFINQVGGTGWAFVEDGSWTRLRYATLAYRLPAAWLGKSFVKGAELSVTGRNLLLLTNYSGADPETAAAGAGVRGGGSGGFDYGSTPATRGVDMAIRVNF